MAVRSAVTWPDGTAYLFLEGDVYDRYDLATGRCEARALPVSDWPGLPGSPDSLLWWGAGKAIAYYGGGYVRYDVVDGRADEGYDPPRRTRTAFPGMDELPERWDSGFDASVNWGDGQTYLFRADEVVRFDIGEDRVGEGYPRPIARDWPAAIADGIDAVLYPGGRFAYFFRDDRFLRHDRDAGTMDAPRPIAEFALDPTPSGGMVPARQLTAEQARGVLADLVARGLVSLDGDPAAERVTLAATIGGVRFRDIGGGDTGGDRLVDLDPRMAVALYRLTRWMSSREIAVTEILHFPLDGDGRGFDIAGFTGELDGRAFTRSVLEDWGALPARADGGVRLDPIGDDLFRLAYGFGTYECESSGIGLDNRFPPIVLGGGGRVAHPDHGDADVRARHRDHIRLRIGAD